MKKLKMVMVAGVFVAVSVLSVSGLVFADDQAAPATAPAMTNTSSVAPAPAATPDSTPAPAPAPETTPAPAPAE